eukprot:445657-Pelagomonas_calceolata.AAC.1
MEGNAPQGFPAPPLHSACLKHLLCTLTLRSHSAAHTPATAHPAAHAAPAPPPEQAAPSAAAAPPLPPPPPCLPSSAQLPPPAAPLPCSLARARWLCCRPQCPPILPPLWAQTAAP